MRLRVYKYLLFFLIVFNIALIGKTQVPNPCRVKAGIYPTAADSVVPVNTVIAFTDISTNATSVKWLYDGAPSGISGPVWNYSVSAGIHTISLVAYNGNCSDTTTVVYFSAGIAHDVDSMLFGNYGTYKFNEEGTCIDKTLDSGFVLGGVQYLWGDECGEAGIVVKTRDKGCIDWSKKFLSSFFCNSSRVTNIYASADTNYYVVIEELELAKLDKNGKLVWIYRYNLNNWNPLSINVVSGDLQGNVFIVGSIMFNGMTITKLNKDGAVVWNKFYRLSYDVFGSTPDSEFSTPNDMIWLNGKLYISGNAYSKENSTYFGYITKIDPISGARDWQYGYTDTESPNSVNFTDLALYDTLLMVSSGVSGHTITLIDQQGVVKKSIKAKFSSSYGPKATKASADSKGHIYMMQWTEEPLPLQPYYWYATNIAEIDTSLNKYWGMVFAQYTRGFFTDATIGLDGKFGIIGEDYGYVDDGRYSSRDFKLIKVDTINSAQNCFERANGYNISVKTINRLNFNYFIDSSLSITPSLATTFTTTDAYIQARYNCPDFIDSCSYMKLSGPATLCSLADTYTYRIHRNRKCVLKPQWKLPAGVTIIQQTDSSLSVKFSGFGVYKIEATLQSCIPVKDSLFVNIASKTAKMNLGKDTVLCANTSVTLHAGSSFLTYKWSDGSSDSVLTVSQPGIYWVQVSDSCGNGIRDSITINPYNVAISIGPDRSICYNDTLQLHGPAGFLNYQWYNDYKISSLSSQHVIVQPLTDTSYYLRVEKLPGCFAYDTVKIKVNNSPPIQLGPDKSFCKGDSALLDAGLGFSKYLWSNGSTLQQITVFNKGEFSIIGITPQGCRSFDTILIVNIWDKPVVNLNDDSTLCIGSSRTFNAGIFASYVWQDLSSAPTFTANDKGIYYVTVTDYNQCRGSDTVHITKLLPLPAHFLPADTAVCKYDKLVIMPNNRFSSYLWSTNSTASSITITTPGLYWLQVTDANRCIGEDSILVNPKDCLTGLYVPNAFTPNDDHLNDVIHPFVGGNTLFYEFSVFNRWGKLVFFTEEKNKGWDGRVKGYPQDPGMYTWKCVYQFEGEERKTASGIIMLLR